MWELISAYCKKHELTMEGYFSVAYAFRERMIPHPDFVHNHVEAFRRHEILPQYVESYTLHQLSQTPPHVVIF